MVRVSIKCRKILNINFFLADLQMKPYRTDEFVHKLFYESARFTAFNNQWVVKAFINTKNQRDPTQCSDRDMKYQVRNNVVLKITAVRLYIDRFAWDANCRSCSRARAHLRP